jgi:hypothetical protein
MEEHLYYFFDYKVETATVEIHLPGWQKLTEEEINIYKSGEYKRIVKTNNHYSFCINDEFDLEQYKRIKIEFISGESFARGEQIIPDYKYMNCLISKGFVERGESPIYNNYIELMQEYECVRRDLRNEFYRCKSLIENAKTKEEIDQINFEYEKRV